MLMLAYVHIEYSTYQFSEESKGDGIRAPPPLPYGTEKSVVLGGLILTHVFKFWGGGRTSP